MNIPQIKKDIQTAKLHIDSMEMMLLNCMNILYAIEERITDEEEKAIYETTKKCI